jgi:subtilisin family serine protease
MKRVLLAAAVLAALAAPASATAARYAVGVAAGTSLNNLAGTIEQRDGAEVTSGDVALRALFVDAPNRQAFVGLPGVAYVERVDGAKRRLAFVPNDPLYTRQWYLTQINAFEYWAQEPALPGGPLVAVLDSGIDGDHPEFKGRIANAKSFIGGSAYYDKRGHGTFVAGLMAAATGNDVGISGIAFPAQLLVAKVARSDGTITLDAEARAIRWAVDNGADVINLSLAGVRDPFQLNRDTYSPLEASAVSYARRHGTLVVAAVGNSDQAPRSPWNYAGYPAALPHVLGVSAIGRDGAVPTFSNRDMIYNDVSAPGEDIYSTVPRGLSGSKANCPNPGYSECGPPEYRRAEGTSFSAPQVAAAAALLMAVRPGLRPDQVSWLLERTAQDAVPASGCKACSIGRDRYTGWGRLTVSDAVQAVLDGEVPRPDQYESNDDAGRAAWPIKFRRGTLTATLDYWDDSSDLYRIRLKRGMRLTVTVKGPSGADVNLALWKPGTRTVQGLLAKTRNLAAKSASPGNRERINKYRVRHGGQYYVEVRISRPGFGGYALSISKRS